MRYRHVRLLLLLLLLLWMINFSGEVIRLWRHRWGDPDLVLMMVDREGQWRWGSRQRRVSCARGVVVWSRSLTGRRYKCIIPIGVGRGEWSGFRRWYDPGVDNGYWNAEHEVFAAEGLALRPRVSNYGNSLSKAHGHFDVNGAANLEE